MVLNGAEIITEILKAQSVDRVFYYSGDAVPEIQDALEASKDSIFSVLTARGQSAVYAADGYSRVTGRTGLVIATGEAGKLNMITGIAAAYMDGVPMVAIVCRVYGNLIGTNSFRGNIALSIAKQCFTVRKISELDRVMQKAFYLAQEGRKGPVLIEVTREVVWSLYDFTPGTIYREDIESLPVQEEISKAADMINAAKRPVVIYGAGAADSSHELLAFMRKASIPGVHTLMSVSTLPFDEPLNLGMAGAYKNLALKQILDCSDLIIAVGIRFSDRLMGDDKSFASAAKILHIDATPGEISKNVTADMSLIGNVGKILALLYPLINRRVTSTSSIPTVTRQNHVIFDIMGELYPDSVYTTDAGPHQMMAAKYIRHKSPTRFISCGGLGTMGFGYCAAIGAAMGLGRRVFHITGEDSFHINLIEAVTAVTYAVPVISIIFNNRTSDTVRGGQSDYIQQAVSCGVKGYSCGNAVEFRKVLRKTVEHRGPVWIELKIYGGGFNL